MAETFDWRSPDSDHAFAEHGRSAFAWEFLRRNPAYRQQRAALLAQVQGGKLRRSRMETALARCWGVIAAPDPDETDPQQVLWRVDLDPACIPLLPALRGAGLAGGFRLDLKRLPHRWSGPLGRYHASVDGRIRVWLASDRENASLAVLLPIDTALPARVQAAMQLAPHPRALRCLSYNRLTAFQRWRLPRLIRALDGHMQGATSRQIGAAIFGLDIAALPRVLWSCHSARKQIARLVRGGMALRDGGYLLLLRGGRNQGRSSPRGKA
ncbi:MAG: DUF2285 domain-containing protein [Sphingobium sp.]